MNVLVTGVAGFFGSNLVHALLERGDEVRVLDNFSTGDRENLAGLVEVAEGELRSYERVHDAVRGFEVGFRLGALGSIPRSVQDPLASSAVNIEGTLTVLLAARDDGIRRVVFSSSSSIYGMQDELPVREDLAPGPISPYGVAKLAAERYRVSFACVYDSLETVALRHFNVSAGVPSTVDSPADAIGQILGRPVRRRSAPPRPGDVRRPWADISAARRTLGYEPRIALEEGLRRTAEALLA
jgi:nucleoside-diphosphate-sugar epimerase